MDVASPYGIEARGLQAIFLFEPRILTLFPTVSSRFGVPDTPRVKPNDILINANKLLQISAGPEDKVYAANSWTTWVDYHWRAGEVVLVGMSSARKHDECEIYHML
jgi:hypothetical protein